MTFKESGKKKAVTFSFDDGVVQDVRLIELLNKYGLKATFNLNSELLGKGGMLQIRDTKICHYCLRPEDVKSTYEGHEIAAHTLTHPNLTTLNKDEIIHQVEQDRINLSSLCGYEVVGMAYPCGGVNNNDEVAQIIKENTGIKYCRTIESNKSFDIQKNLYRFNPSMYFIYQDELIEMGKKFIDSTPDSPQIFYIWGHSYEADFKSEFYFKLEEFFKLISQRDDIFYGTNKEVLL